MKRYLPIPLIAAAALLAGCGGADNRPAVPTARVLASSNPCPAGRSFMGCAAPTRRGLVPSNRAAPAGGRFPDVSSWQGHPNWSAARPYISGAVAKAFEYGQDPDLVYNVNAFKALHLRWAAYDFVRFCDASGFIAALRSVGGPTSAPPILDMEVPSAAGCAPTLERQIFAAFHRVAEIYTAPGTWPGGSNAGLGVWEATFGSGFVAIWHPVHAWQYTDGVYGSRTYIPGIGYGDVSIDYGLLEIQPTPPGPVYPRCYSHRIPAAQCAAVKRQVAGYQRGQSSSQRAYVARGCVALSAREQWFAAAIRRQPHTRLAYRKGALAATRKAESRQQCQVFSGRVSYFGSLVKQTTAGH